MKRRPSIPYIVLSAVAVVCWIISAILASSTTARVADILAAVCFVTLLGIALHLRRKM